jgi:hypothetical protein
MRSNDRSCALALPRVRYCARLAVSGDPPAGLSPGMRSRWGRCAPSVCAAAFLAPCPTACGQAAGRSDTVMATWPSAPAAAAPRSAARQKRLQQAPHGTHARPLRPPPHGPESTPLSLQFALAAAPAASLDADVRSVHAARCGHDQTILQLTAAQEVCVPWLQLPSRAGPSLPVGFQSCSVAATTLSSVVKRPG